MITILAYAAALAITIPAILAGLLQLPDVSLDSGIGSALSTAGHYYATVDAFFPISTLIAVFIGVHIALEAIIFIYKGTMWVIRKLPGIS